MTETLLEKQYTTTHINWNDTLGHNSSAASPPPPPPNPNMIF